MISNRSGKDPVTVLSTLSAISAPGSLFIRSLHELQRLSRGKALRIASLVLPAAATSLALHHFHTLPSSPLAAAPPVLRAEAALAASAAPPAPRQTRHHSLLPGTLNPLSGIASWYGQVLHGHTTASGDIFDETELTAAHRTLPFGTRVRVTDVHTSRSVVVRINDRGVLAPDRVIDLSSAAATELGILRTGLAKVRLEILPHHPEHAQGGE